MGSGALVVVVPGDLETLTGGYGYDRRIIAGLRDRGWTVDVRQIDGSFPAPTPAALADVARVLRAIPDGTTVLIDGLAFGAMPIEAEREAGRLRLTALVHHPLAAETGIDAALAAKLRTSERRALACAQRVIVTSRATANILADYDVPADRIVVVEPGTDRPSVSRPSSIQPSSVPSALSLQPPALLCVATFIPRKGHEVLFRALATLRDLPWRLTCVGGLDRDPMLVAGLLAQVHADGLDERVTFAGEMSGSTLDAEYARADLFLLPTLYEGYGMVVAEALAHGVPVISTATGGIEELVHGVSLQSDPAGLLVPPGDSIAFASALRRVLTESDLRAQLTRGAEHARDRIPTWDRQVERMALALSSDSDDVGRFLRTRSVTTFSADWLALREPADITARSASLTAAVSAALPSSRPLRILDLGAGTGANARYLIEKLPSPQDWLLVDHDERLLARARTSVPSRADCAIETARADLVAILKGSRYGSRDLITASALLDLISEAWLRALAQQCALNRTVVLLALTYDGRIECSPADPEDQLVRGLVNRHQHIDKGFGPALGPDACGVAARCFSELGYDVRRERSDWVLTADATSLQEQLIDGWSKAAIELEPGRSEAIEAWRARRLGHVASARSKIVVGHEDLAAWKSETQN
jgi:glycosyltransferase involved in cell wall biosynthesis/SAM-dependent methyltransferase